MAPLDQLHRFGLVFCLLFCAGIISMFVFDSSYSQRTSTGLEDKDDVIREHPEYPDLYEDSPAITRLRSTNKVGMIRRVVDKLAQKKTNRSRRLGRDISKDISKWEKLAYRLSSASKVPEFVGNMDMWYRVLDPDGKWCYNWMGLVTLSTLYNIAVIILRLAFSEMRQMWLACFVFGALDIICDSVYIADIWVQSRISYHEDGCLIEDLGKTSTMYRRQTKFKLDLAAIFPLYLVASLVFGTFHFALFDISFVSRHDLFTPLTRIPRLLKVYTISSFFDATDCRTSNPNSVRAFKLSLYLCLVIHWIGCLYYILSEFEGLGSTEWVYNTGTLPDTFSRKYIRCIYWSLLILTTIGERPPPETDIEYMFTGMTFVIGVFIFAAVVGNVGDVISNLNASRQEFQARMDQVKFYMQHRQVPVFLQDRVKRWAQYTWARTQAIDEPQLLQMLPERLQMDVAIQVHLNTLKKVKIFEECEEGLLRELVLKLRPQIYSPGDYICHVGDIGREMYIINHGKIQIIVPNKDTGQRTVVATLSAGNYFGEISLLKLDAGHNRRTADVRSVGYSELLCLSRKDLMAALVEYPDAKEIVETQARERMRQTLELRSSEETKSVSAPKIAVTDKYKRGRRDTLLDVIQSDGFKQLLKQTRGVGDMSDVQKIVTQLRECQSQALQLTKQKASEDVQRLETQLQQTQECLKAAYIRISELQIELGRRSIKTSKSNRNVHTSRSNLNGNGIDHESTSFSRASSPRKLSTCNTYLPDNCIPEPKLENPVGNTSLQRSMSNDATITKDIHSYRNNFSSWDCLKRVASRVRNDERLTRSKSNFEQCNNHNKYVRNNSVLMSKDRRDSSLSKANEPHQPARQSSGYSSDTETMATLMRVSNVLQLQRSSWESSSESCNTSDEESDSSSERRDSNFSGIGILFNPASRKHSVSLSSPMLKSSVSQNTLSPQPSLSVAMQEAVDIERNNNGAFTRRNSVFSSTLSSNRRLSKASQSNISGDLKARTSKNCTSKDGSKAGRKHTSTPNLVGAENGSGGEGMVQGSTIQRRLQSNVAIGSPCLNDRLSNVLRKDINFRETNV